MAAQLTAMNGLAARGLSAMDEAREHFLAGARLADDQHRAIAAGHAARQVDDQSRRRVDRDRLQRFAQFCSVPI